MIKIVAPGKIKDKHLTALINDYAKKINHYHKLEIVETKDVPITSNDSIDNIKNKEAVEILSKIGPNDFVICLDLNGKEMDSVFFSGLIDQTFVRYPVITFVIGGSLGIGDEVLKRANLKWKLSDLTFLHQMVRLILLEQIYRAFKILKNETYHK